MSSPGTIYPTVGGKLWKYLGTNATIDDILASSTDSPNGTIWYSATSLSLISASTAAVLTRNAQGDYSYNRTAGGAETHYAICQPELPTTVTALKGFKLTGFWLSYTLGVVAATTVTPTVNQTVYANTVANAVTGYGGVITYDANHNTNALRIATATSPHLMNVQWPTTSYQNARATLLSVEVAFVLANTGTLAVNAYGFDYTFNFNGS